MTRMRCAAASIAACTCIGGAGVAAGAANAAATLHFFSKDVYFRFSDANGKPLPQNAQPAPGDRLSIASNDYVGNHKHHTKRPTASDRISCTVMSNGNGLCDGTIAIGGSLIIGDDFVLNFNSNARTTVKITGGTGAFKNAHGTVIAKTVNRNATDLTINVR